MRPIHHILCPVDFSTCSQRALELAKGLSEDFLAELSVYHVVDLTALSLGALDPVPDAFEVSQQRATSEMEALAKRLEPSRAHLEITTGFPHRMIARKVREANLDLVVMGTHGASGFEKLFLGSTTEKVLHQIEVPLLAVPPRAQLAPDAAALAAHGRFGTILLAVDLSKSSVATAEYALALTRQYRARLLVVHAFEPPIGAYSGSSAWLQEAGLRSVFERMMSERRAQVRELIPDSLCKERDVQIEVLQGVAFEVIRRMAEQRDVDLVVMGAHGYGKSALGWLGSTAHKMIRSAPCPVLTVRGKA